MKNLIIGNLNGTLTTETLHTFMVSNTPKYIYGMDAIRELIYGHRDQMTTNNARSHTAAYELLTGVNHPKGESQQLELAFIKGVYTFTPTNEVVPPVAVPQVDDSLLVQTSLKIATLTPVEILAVLHNLVSNPNAPKVVEIELGRPKTVDADTNAAMIAYTLGAFMGCKGESYRGFIARWGICGYRSNKLTLTRHDKDGKVDHFVFGKFPSVRVHRDWIELAPPYASGAMAGTSHMDNTYDLIETAVFVGILVGANNPFMGMKNVIAKATELHKVISEIPDYEAIVPNRTLINTIQFIMVRNGKVIHEMAAR